MVVKAYKDGDRLILVIENCTENLEEMLLHYLADVTEVPGLQPMPQTDEKIEIPEEKTPSKNSLLLMPDEPYNGMSVQEAIAKDGVSAAIQAAFFANSLDGKEKAFVMALVKKCLKEDLTARKTAGIEKTEKGKQGSIEDFFLTYEPLLANLIKDILVRYECASLGEFLKMDRSILKKEYDSVFERLLRSIS